jgi:hypothetical protein
MREPPPSEHFKAGTSSVGHDIKSAAAKVHVSIKLIAGDMPKRSWQQDLWDK